MRVLDQSQYIRKKKYEEDSQMYSTEFLSYDKNKGTFIIRIHRHNIGNIQAQSYTVEMNDEDIDALQLTNHIKEAFDFVEKMSEGYRPIGVHFTKSDDEFDIYPCYTIEMDDYVRTTNGFICSEYKFNNTIEGMKIYWRPINDIIFRDGPDWTESLNGHKNIKDDIDADIEEYREIMLGV